MKFVKKSDVPILIERNLRENIIPFFLDAGYTNIPPLVYNNQNRKSLENQPIINTGNPVLVVLGEYPYSVGGQRIVEKIQENPNRDNIAIIKLLDKEFHFAEYIGIKPIKGADGEFCMRNFLDKNPENTIEEVARSALSKRGYEIMTDFSNL